MERSREPPHLTTDAVTNGAKGETTAKAAPEHQDPDDDHGEEAMEPNEETGSAAARFDGGAIALCAD